MSLISPRGTWGYSLAVYVVHALGRRARRQPAHPTSVPWNRKSCSTNMTVAVALQAFLYGQSLCKGLPSPLQARMHFFSWSLIPAIARFLWWRWYRYVLSHMNRQIRAGNSPFFPILFCFTQLSCAHSVAKDQKKSKAESMQVVGLLFHKPPAYANVVQVKFASLPGS